MKMNKKFLFFGIIVSCALIIPTFTFAGFWDWIVGALTFIPNLLVIILLQVVILATGLLSAIVGSILTWVISPNFVNVSYTSPTNPIIRIGLDITGGFVNIGLVLALIVIAFTTILRIEHYDTKRLLAKLILVALLVNFAPVICGLIVDACNIVMYYFTQHVRGLSILTNTLRNIGDTLWRSITQIKLTEQVATIVVSLLFILFNLMLAFILLILTFLFVIRYVAIWLAVILAPIAFVCWILPATKRWWDWWWNNFLGWCLIGVTAGFFLYLSAKISENMGEIFRNASMPDIEETSVANRTAFSTMLYQVIPIASLYIGLTLGLQTGAMGAGAIINFARKTAKGVAGSKTVQRGLGTVAGAIPVGADRVGSWLRRMEEGARQRGGAGGRVLGAFLGASAAYTERGSNLMARYFLPYAARARKTDIPKGFDDLTPDEQARIVRGYASSRNRIQLGAHMARTGTLGKVSDENFKNNMAAEAELATRNPATRTLLNKEINDIYSVLPDRITAEAKINLTSQDRQAEMQNRINKKVQEIQHKMATDSRYGQEINDYRNRTGRSLRDIAAGAIHFEDLKPTEIAKLSPSSFRTIEARLGAERITPNKFATILANFDVDTAEGLLNAPGGWNYMLNQARTPEEQDKLLVQFQRENPHLMRWFFMSETGRNIQFAGRERMRTEFEGYTNFQRGMEEASSILDRMQSLRTVNTQLIDLQNRINQAIQEGQRGRARILTINFGEIEKKTREIINATQDINEIRETYNNLGNLLLSPGFRRGESYRTVTSINAELRNRYRELSGGQNL